MPGNGAISYNFEAVESSSMTFNQIVKDIGSNNDQLRAMESGLKASFTGEGADGWHQQIDRLMAKITDYSDALGRLQATVVRVASRGGDMHNTDKEQAGRFLSVNI